MRLTIRQEGQADRAVEASAEGFTIGRDDVCDLVLDDDEASRQHARLDVAAGGETARIEDLGSRNGTYVNGRRIEAAATVSAGDEILIGTTRLVVESASEPGATRARAGVAPGQPPPPTGRPEQPSAIRRTQSAVQRAMLQRSVRRVTVIAGIAVAAAAVAIVLAVTGVFSSGSEPVDVSQVVDDVRASTVDVSAEQGGRQIGGGSGWVLDAEQGLIVTNAHVVGAGETFQAGLEGQLQKASVVGVAVCDDLAVLKVDDTEGLKTMALGSQADLQQGDKVFVVGFPANASATDELTVTQGIVSIVMATADSLAVVDPDFQVYPNVIQTDAAINGGNSGGPLVNEDEQLVGVNTFTSGGENQGYAIGVDRVKELVPQLSQGESQSWAGFDFRALSVNEQQRFGVGGLEVTTAVDGTSGAKVGFGKVDALITQVNGVPVTTREDYCKAMGGLASGDQVTFSGVDTNGARFNVKLPLE